MEVDTSRVIDEVRQRKLLWDASDRLYKNKDARIKAWEDIADTLFENISAEEKQQLGELIKQRWKTARDAYFGTKNAIKKTPSESGAPKYKKYIFYNELSFLAPTVENEVDESLRENIPSVPSPSVNTDSTATLDSMVTTENTQDSVSMLTNTPQGEQRPWLEKRKRNAPKANANSESTTFERELLTLLSNQTPDLAADDLAFFASLGPLLKSFDLEQKLEFRTRVMRDATRIKNRSSNRSNSSASLYSNETGSTPHHDWYGSSYNYQTRGYSGYETNNTNTGSSGYQTAEHNNE